MGRVQFPFILQCLVIASQGKAKRPTERRIVTIFCLHHDLVLFVTTHNYTFAGQLRQVVVDVTHVNLHSARSRSWWLTLARELEKQTNKKHT